MNRGGAAAKGLGAAAGYASVTPKGPPRRFRAAAPPPEPPAAPCAAPTACCERSNLHTHQPALIRRPQGPAPCGAGPPWPVPLPPPDAAPGGGTGRGCTRACAPLCLLGGAPAGGRIPITRARHAGACTGLGRRRRGLGPAGGSRGPRRRWRRRREAAARGPPPPPVRSAGTGAAGGGPAGEFHPGELVYKCRAMTRVDEAAGRCKLCGVRGRRGARGAPACRRGALRWGCCLPKRSRLPKRRRGGIRAGPPRGEGRQWQCTLWLSHKMGRAQNAAGSGAPPARPPARGGRVNRRRRRRRRRTTGGGPSALAVCTAVHFFRAPRGRGAAPRAAAAAAPRAGRRPRLRRALAAACGGARSAARRARRDSQLGGSYHPRHPTSVTRRVTSWWPRSTGRCTAAPACSSSSPCA
jgi:hypothetical protein